MAVKKTIPTKSELKFYQQVANEKFAGRDIDASVALRQMGVNAQFCVGLRKVVVVENRMVGKILGRDWLVVSVNFLDLYDASVYSFSGKLKAKLTDIYFDHLGEAVVDLADQVSV